MPINLVSDTVTRPSNGMKEFMMSSELGDDVFGQDPTINTLEQKVAKMFNKEAAIFCPSGTMTNQIAIKCHTQPLDEMLCDKDSHVYQYETGGYAFNSGIAVKLIDGKYGKISPHQVLESLNPDYDWLPRSRLLVIENSCNKGGGSFYTLPEMSAVGSVARENSLKFHLDGARIFNVLVETGEKTEEIGDAFDSISICFSKGLGAPVGSALIGDLNMIKQARRYRKAMGGGMRQAGMLAGACIYALDNNIKRLKIDNDRAKVIAKLLQSLPWVKSIKPVMTNILIFQVIEDYRVHDVLDRLSEKGVLATQFGPDMIRFTFHMDVKEEDMVSLKRILTELG